MVKKSHLRSVFVLVMAVFLAGCFDVTIDFVDDRADAGDVVTVTTVVQPIDRTGDVNRIGIGATRRINALFRQ